MGCASAVAARLGAGFASDVLGLTVEKGDIVATRGAYGNKLNLEVCFPNKGIVVLDAARCHVSGASRCRNGC